MSKKIMIFDLKNSLSIIFILLIVTLIILIGKNNIMRSIETSTKECLIPIYSVETDKKVVALTFDCAWGAKDINKIIEILQKNNIEATFFVVGKWATKNKTAIKNLHKAGMEIGNHSDTHEHVISLSYNENYEDMKKCNEKIYEIIGEEAKFYRGPYGEYNNAVIKAAEKLQMEVIQWSLDTLDYEGKTPKEICNRIRKRIRNGSIILMHNDTKYTAEGLQEIIDCINNEGYEILPLEEVIYKDNYEINFEGRQFKKK